MRFPGAHWPTRYINEFNERGLMSQKVCCREIERDTCCRPSASIQGSHNPVHAQVHTHVQEDINARTTCPA